MKKNILTIDMDFMSNIYLQHHSAFVGGLVTDNYWNKVLDLSGTTRNSFVDNKHNLMYIFNVFMGVMKNNDNIVFGTFHDSILNHIDLDRKEDEYYVVNIDHHHDISYAPVHSLESSKYGECGEANWIAVLGSRLKEYTWVRNLNSVLFQGVTDFSFYFPLLKDAPDLKNTEWDLVYVALSPNYTADDHWFYYFMLIDLFETFKGRKAVVDVERYTEIVSKYI